MPKTEVNGTTFHYITAGEGPNLVMLHGMLGNLAVWHLRIVPLMRDQFHIVTYDLRGHGYSDVTPSGYTPHQMAEDLRGILDALGIRRTHLVGHSYGAQVCLQFALLYPDRVDRLVALEASLMALLRPMENGDWTVWEYWVRKLEESGFEIPDDKKTNLEYLLGLTLETPKSFGPARGLPRNKNRLSRLIHDTALIRESNMIGELTAETIRRIETPALLVYGDQSPFLNSLEFLRRQLPNCSSVLLPGGEHFGPLEQPDLLAAHITSFLRESSSAAAAPFSLVLPEPKSDR